MESLNCVEKKTWKHLAISISKTNTCTGLIMQMSLQLKESRAEQYVCTGLIDRKHGPNKRAVSGNNGKDYKTP